MSTGLFKLLILYSITNTYYKSSKRLVTLTDTDFIVIWPHEILPPYLNYMHLHGDAIQQYRANYIIRQLTSGN